MSLRKIREFDMLNVNSSPVFAMFECYWTSSDLACEAAVRTACERYASGMRAVHRISG